MRQHIYAAYLVRLNIKSDDVLLIIIIGAMHITYEIY